MGAVSALRTTGGALARNPVVFVGTFLVAIAQTLAQAPQFAAQTLANPGISVLVGLLAPIVVFFLTPFLLAGVLGMASEAVGGGTSLGTFVGVGKSRYVALLLATLLYTVLSVVIAVALVIVVVIVVLVFGATTGGGGGDPNLAIAAVIALVVLTLVVGFLLFVFFLQFYAVAVVVDEAGVTESFTRSYRLVRRNILSTLGYNVLSTLVSVLVTLPFLAVAAGAVVLTGSVPSAPPAMTPGASMGFDLSPPVIATGAVGLVLVQLLTSAITRTYSVAFYRDRRPASDSPGGQAGND
jgi:hypothetical protein